jgi:hypothetical protein
MDHKMSNVERVQEVLDWIKTCPYKHYLSSFSNGHVFIKIQIPDKKENKDGS